MFDSFTRYSQYFLFITTLSINEKSPYFLPDSSLIAINISPWFLHDHFTIAIDQFVHLYEAYFSQIKRQNYFSNWNNTWYSWVGKNLDIVASSITSMYDINKTQNSILKIPWFHTPFSIFHETDMPPWTRLTSKNWQQRTYYTFLVAFFCPFLAWQNDQTQYQGNWK